MSKLSVSSIIIVSSWVSCSSWSLDCLSSYLA